MHALVAFLLNPAAISLGALILAIVWMLRDESDRTRPLLVIALVVNLFYGFLLQYVMGSENGLVPWKYDFVLARLDGALGIAAARIAPALQGLVRVPLLVVYQLMVPMMIAWFAIARRYGVSAALVLAYITEMLTGPLLYAFLPACGPVYAFRGQWLHPPAVQPVAIRLSGMPNAFPSLHLGTALVFVLFSGGRVSRAWSVVFLVATALATIATGEHYAIDLVAGLAFGCFASNAGRRRLFPALLWLSAVLAWSAGVRWASGFLIRNPDWLRLFAVVTVAGAVLAVILEWRANWRPAISPAIQAAAVSVDGSE
ncbi:MAG TPA: phosphatase PAP2 family protein [Terracidiphilus sp.]|nr:phosphatase PAP2 family protein [Terracidiphilus sp.]